MLFYGLIDFQILSSSTTGFFLSAIPSYFICYLLIASLCAVILDFIFGEPKRFHPLVAFGRLASLIERLVNPANLANRAKSSLATNITNNRYGTEGHTCLDFDIHSTGGDIPNKSSQARQTRWLGLCSVIMLIVPISLLMVYGLSLVQQHWLSWIIFDSVILYFCIGLKSMRQHIHGIASPLEKHDLPQAKQACAMIVSRDVAEMSEHQIAKAAVESTLENSNDAVIASFFYYLIGGIPLAVAHRLVNTLDSMWGYKTTQLIDFGWAVAKLDDCLAWPTARVTGVLFALQGYRNGLSLIALKNAMTQSRHYKSHNGGWVMAAGATVLNIELGGVESYHGVLKDSGKLGKSKLHDQTLKVKQVNQAVKLMNTAVLIWFVCLAVLSLTGIILLS